LGRFRMVQHGKRFMKFFQAIRGITLLREVC